MAEAINSNENANGFSLTVGGDHCIAVGSVSGILKRYPDIGVIWVDAHADINSSLTTNSGNLHGCPISFLMRIDAMENQEIFSWLDAYPQLDPSRIVHIGLRDVEEGEKETMRKLKMKSYTNSDV